MTTDQQAEGWGYPILANKAHYFREGRSLCRKWMFWGALDPDQSDEANAHDCRDCTRRRTKETANA